MAQPNIIQESCQSKGTELNEKFNKIHGMSEEYVPWIRIGRLYVCSSITVDKSWELIAKTLGDRYFYVIFSGRHGSHLGQSVNIYDGKFETLYEESFFKEDKKIADQFKGNGYNMVVIDTGNNIITKTETGLRRYTYWHLMDGCVVIYAWCFSLYCFDIAGNSYDLADMFREPGDIFYNWSVEQVVKKYFDWVPRY